LRKKILLRGTSKEDFFSANPQGPGLDVKGLVQKFANQKAWGIFKRTLKTPFRRYKVAAKSPCGLSERRRCSNRAVF
jgi:hypothetical protein